jgi:hypothetical protein
MNIDLTKNELGMIINLLDNKCSSYEYEIDNLKNMIELSNMDIKDNRYNIKRQLDSMNNGIGFETESYSNSEFIERNIKKHNSKQPLNLIFGSYENKLFEEYIRDICLSNNSINDNLKKIEKYNEFLQPYKELLEKLDPFYKFLDNPVQNPVV